MHRKLTMYLPPHLARMQQVQSMHELSSRHRDLFPDTFLPKEIKQMNDLQPEKPSWSLL